MGKYVDLENNLVDKTFFNIFLKTCYKPGVKVTRKIKDFTVKDVIHDEYGIFPYYNINDDSRNFIMIYPDWDNCIDEWKY